MTSFVNFTLVAVVVLAVLVLVAKHRKKVGVAWEEAARRLGFPPSPPTNIFSQRRIAGQYRGFAAEVHTFTRGGKNSSTLTRYRVDVPDLRLGLQLKRQGFAAGIAKFFGGQDIQIGDRAFDVSILVRGSDPEAVRKFITPVRRARIRRFLLAHGEGKITDTTIECAIAGVASNPDSMVSTVQELVGLAGCLGEEQLPEDRRLERVLDDQREGRIGEALEGLGVVLMAPLPPPELPESADVAETEFVDTPELVEPPRGVEEKVLEGGLLYLAGREPEAREAFEAAREAAPGDEEVQGWVEQLAAPAPSPTPVNEPPASLDAAAVCLALFGPDVSSFDAMRVFEAQYKDVSVRWRGKLRRIEPFSFDFVFGNEKGAKATIEVGTTNPTAYSESAVLAVVGLPASACDDLGAKVGSEIEFEGTFVKADGFMKNLFVANASVV